MKKVVNIDKAYKCNAKQAIKQFFKKFKQYAEAWQELFENMDAYNIEKED